MNIKEEPVLVGSVVSAIISLLVMLVAMGWIEVSGEQMEAIKGFLVAFLPLLVVVITMIGGLFGRQKAVSVAKLRRNHILPDELL